MRILFLFLIVVPSVLFGQINLQTIVKENGISKSELVIWIDKSDRTLKVKHKDKTLITYDCVLGFNPVDDKQMEGDGCTPEGEFKIRSMYAHSSWTYFIWIDYPNKESWKRFTKRKNDGAIPKTATIGGEIGIHGVPDNSDDLISEGVNWTLGCISLREKDIIDLYKSINKSTTIHIQQ